MQKIKYPRRVFIRNLLYLIGRTIVPILAQPHVQGRENFPKTGPLIVVGNHTGALEVVMMTIYAPWTIEYMGAADIPHESFIYFFMQAYGLIPIHRGNTSRAALQSGLNVLKQNGVIGLFPEGGMWEPGVHKPQSGAAWLSFHSQAPVLPIGFNNLRGAINQALRFKRPVLKMNVGNLIPPVKIEKGKPRKQQLQAAADQIMKAVWHLLPEEDQYEDFTVATERFSLTAKVTDSAGIIQEIPGNLQLSHHAALSKFLFRDILFNTLRDNAKLPIQALQYMHRTIPASKIVDASKCILDYLQTINPYYFTYRYGQREGQTMQNSIQQLHDLALWVQQNDFNLSAVATRRYRQKDSDDEIVEENPGEKEAWKW
jgi:1-acyl-sn-glycerol-3-phosphate acyltransferase